MRAAVYDVNGGPEVLRYAEVPDPVCRPGCVLIRVEAVSVEGGDLIHRLSTPPPSTPYIGGYQAAGEILEVGEGVTDLHVGQRVVATSNAGSHAELWVVPAVVAWPIPDGLEVQRAAPVPIPFGTAYECLFTAGQLTDGETVLVQAGASAVGIAAIQLAKRAGARVFATASSPAKLARLVDLGMDEGIDYTRSDVAAEVRRLTDGRGVDVVVDPVGGSVLQGSLLSLAARGRAALVGNAGREPTTVDVSPLMPLNASLHGVFFGADILSPRVRANVASLLDEVASGELTVLLDRQFPLSEAAEAHAYIESRAAVGRVLLIPG